MPENPKMETRRLLVLALLAALAYVCVLLFRIPVVLFLKYEPKDCLIAIGGMLYGPGAALLLSVVVSLLELVTVSETGWIGFLMNVLSTALFVCPAAFWYRRRRTLGAAIGGLATGILLSTAGMLLWNWLVTPLYMGIPRAQVEALLLPAFLPFNLLKGALNAALTVLLYKTVVSALRAARLVPKPETEPRRGFSAWVALAALFVLASLVLVLLVWQGAV